MGFKKLFASVGIGGASVDTVLSEPNVLPGGAVHGEVRIEGGSVDQEIQGVSVGLQGRVEVEGQDQEVLQNVEFLKQQVGGAFQLQAGASHVVPFTLEIPWETPITTFLGQELRGMHIGVTTELAIARAVDSSDLDPVHVHPLPAQAAILEAFGSLGFRFKSADLEQGVIRGTRQRLPFYQEIEFYAPSQYRGLSQVELSFVADDRTMDVVLEMDKKPGLFTGGSDSYRCFQVDLEHFHQTDWTGYLNQWLAEVGSRRNWF
ncbi:MULTISPECIES: sporulation protein [unclassified Streptomyces]|uniref:sporulation protein n=1 Tax=unclassified Streptomyces TaxID=2593676 RepID=UPI0022B68CA5|nr:MULTISPECIES: sporulation protein [unclassified Streptomyces]MCZ7413531.1 sporulation protein [Streptomyces sp. WMMC897]MCZ7430526.1 sporulation protein [Streptomyces sp. WMMC1477]